jgi:Ca2+-binding RTX toxin-like protein
MRGILVAGTVAVLLGFAGSASAAQLSGEPDRYVFVGGVDSEEVDVDEGDPGRFTILVSVNTIDLDAGAASHCTDGGTEFVDCARPPDQLRLNLNGGDDATSIDEVLSMTFTVNGGDGDDTLDGGSLRDSLTGGPGEDEIAAGDGDDTVFARDGEADFVDCGDGADTVEADLLDSLTDCEGVSLPRETPPPPPAGAVRCAVPSLRGRTVPRARALLVSRHCRLGRVGHRFSRRVRKGRILSQDRRPGLRLARGAKVDVVVSRGRRR